MTNLSESPFPVKPNSVPSSAVREVRFDWQRKACSPWAGYEMRHSAVLADGSVHEMDGGEALALVAALRAAGARLVESVEGWSRVAGGVSPAVGVRPATVEEAVEQMVAKGQAARPALAGRLDAAAGLVLAGRVELDGDEARLGPYTITAEGCTCRDFQYRGGWCKHRLAVRMARHLVANGFALPQAREEEPAPQISAANRALIGSGRVVDKVQRQERAYRESTHGARSAALRLMANGATTLPADLARRAGITNYERQVLNDDGGRQ